MAKKERESKTGKKKNTSTVYKPVFELALEEFDLDDSLLMQNLLDEELSGTTEQKQSPVPAYTAKVEHVKTEENVPPVSETAPPESIPADMPNNFEEIHETEETNSSQEGHRDRLKKRFLREGLDYFPDHTILELLLFFGIRCQDTNEVAHRLIDQFGSFSQALQADYEQLVSIEGMTPNAAVLLKMMPQVSRRYIEQLTPATDQLNTSQKVGEFLIPKFLGRSEEVVYLLCFNNACHLLRCDLISEGGLSRAAFDVRKIVEIAYQCKAVNVILAHNHPNGLARPSSQDVRITETLASILHPVGIELLDHMIVSGEDFVSLMELGYLGVQTEGDQPLF
ncbi:MAG: JAB domain-containing protein [Candidatus Merdivicinus sp.]|jgi:DNA repair protein RadC